MTNITITIRLSELVRAVLWLYWVRNWLDHHREASKRRFIALNLFQSISEKHSFPIIETEARNVCQTNCHVVYFPKNFKPKKHIFYVTILKVGELLTFSIGVFTTSG